MKNLIWKRGSIKNEILHPPAADSPCRASRGLLPPSGRVMPGTHKKKKPGPIKARVSDGKNIVFSTAIIRG
ncbi:hypothetical protein ISS37_10345 [candidate division KSB1 bacterium]|nr:hypothetical protein [candidate division KSB1 bacterium]